MTDLPDTLIVIPGSDLPPQGWSSRYDTILDRDVFVSPTRAESMSSLVRTQPSSGGLYTSSLVYVGDELVGTQWTLNNPIYDLGLHAYLVHPKPDAKILVIDSKEDLVAAIERWPHHEAYPYGPIGHFHRDRRSTVDWPAAAQEVDAVWLTVKGNNAVHLSEPGLNTWDTEQVLWLTPAFVVGQRIHLPQDEVLEKLRARWLQNEVGTVFSNMLRDPDADESKELIEWLKTVPQEALDTLNEATGLDLSVDANGDLQGLPSPRE